VIDDLDPLDLIEVCPECGVPCMGTYILWIEVAGERRRVELDQPTLDGVFEEASGPDASAIVRAWNALDGWTAAVEGAPIDAAELLQLLERHGPGLSAEDRLQRLAAFVRGALELGATLFILDN
jgi:hypothetical protein